MELTMLTECINRSIWIRMKNQFIDHGLFTIGRIYTDQCQMKHIDQHSDQRSLEMEHLLSDREWSEIHRLDED